MRPLAARLPEAQDCFVEILVNSGVDAKGKLEQEGWRSEVAYGANNPTFAQSKVAAG